MSSIGNTFLISDKNVLLKNKLAKIASNLDKSISSSKLQTREDLLSETIRVLETFYKDLQEPAFNPETFTWGDYPDPELYNKIWNSLLETLSVLFLELENVESLTLSNFNFTATEANRLLARLKAISGKLGDYILYSTHPTRDKLFFTDSFGDVSKLDINSSLLNKNQSVINQNEGIVTLPIDTSIDSLIQVKEKPVINPNSNGVSGNNQQVGARANNDITKLLDDNADTWFEYEKVVTDETKDKLVLDITLNLTNPTIINHLRINPNNFGTKTVIEIEKIETSVDGAIYTSIKDDIPIANFLSSDQEDVFTLAPSASKYAGQGIYTFTPRKAKYIHLVFSQSEPYVIETINGDRLRYAIGIRDIEIRAFTFLPEGEFVSKEFSTSSQVRKVALDTNQNPAQESELASIDYFVSPDNGISWHQIRPKQFTGESGRVSEIPELLDFNGSTIDSIKTSIPPLSLRLKGTLKRNDDIFKEGSSSLKKIIVSTSEIHSVPDASPFSFELTKNPVKDSVEIIDPLYGSRGIKSSPYILGHGVESKLDQLVFYLPFKNLPRPVKKVLSGSAYHTIPVPSSEWMHVLVGGEEWTQATQALSSYSADYSSAVAYRLYSFNPADAKLQFGTGSDTVRPPLNAPVGVYFDAEQLYPSSAVNNHKAKLEFRTTNFKEDVTLKRYDKIKEETEIVPKHATVIKLAHNEIVDKTNIQSTMTGLGFTTEKTFLNGRDELSASTHWSIDTENGVIYTTTPTSNSTDTSFRYTYQPIVILSTSDWDWITNETIKDSLLIKESVWKTIEEKDLSLPVTSGIKILELAHLAVVKGTLSLSLTDTAGTSIEDSVDPFLKEVDFIDGSTELGLEIKKTVETIPTLTPGSGNIASFTLREAVSSNTSGHIVTFSDTSIFVQEDANLDSVGDWTIDRTPSSSTYGKVQVVLSSSSPNTSPGTITYFYTDSNYADNGLYSVDYKNGKIFLQRSMQGGTWSLKATYEYTNYKAEYKIARALNPNFYNIDVTNKTVVIKDSEILTRSLLPKDRMSGTGLYYQVNYNYVGESLEDAAELAPYFSPIVKDYSLSVITKDRIL